MDRRVLVLLAVSILLVLSLIGIADPSKLAEIFRTSDPMMVVLAVAAYTSAIIVFALIWQVLLKAADMELSVIDNLRLVFSSVFFNVITPTASFGGEAVRIYLLSRKFGLDSGRGAATIVAHRIIGTVSNSLGTMLLGLYLIIFYSVPVELMAIIAFVTISSFFGFLLFLYFGLRIEWSKRFFNGLFDRLSRFKAIKQETRSAFYESLESYNEGLMVLIRSKKAVLLSMLLGLVTWFVVNLVAVFSFSAVGGVITVENFLLVFTFFSVSRLIPTGLPEFVGSKEAIFAALYAAAGLPLSLSIAVSFIIRIASQLWMIILGGAITLQLGVEGFGKKA